MPRLRLAWPIATALLIVTLWTRPARTTPRKPVPAPKLPLVVDIDDLDIGLKGFKGFRRSMIPERILRLHGKRVRIYGNMAPTFKSTGIKGFLFHGETRGRRYVGPAALRAPVHYSMPVYLRKSTTTSYTRKPILIEGRFEIRPWVVDGECYRLYKIKDATVRETQRRPGYTASISPGC